MMQCIRHRTVTSRARQVTFCRKPMSEVGYAPDVAFHLTALAAGEAVSLFCARQAPGRTSSSCPTSSEAVGLKLAVLAAGAKLAKSRPVGASEPPNFRRAARRWPSRRQSRPEGTYPQHCGHRIVTRPSSVRARSVPFWNTGVRFETVGNRETATAAPSSQEGCGAERPMPRVLVTVRGASRKRRDRRRMSWFAVRPLHTTPKERRATSNRERRKRHTREI
jgi:hypothetical protein